jgi:dodecin
MARPDHCQSQQQRAASARGSAAYLAVQSKLNQNQGELQMAQKVIDVVGTSKESFAKAAENAVAEAAKTVRGMKWARVAEFEMELDGKKIVQYRTTARIYFDIEK